MMDLVVFCTESAEHSSLWIFAQLSTEYDYIVFYVAHSQAGSSRKPDVDSMCGGGGDKNASQKQAGEGPHHQQKAE